MNRFVIRIGLGLAIYLSSSALDSNPSWASSLKYSDRYELTRLGEKTSVSFGLSLITSDSNFDDSRQSEPQETPDLNFSYTQTRSNSSRAREIQELFFVPTFNIQIQTATAESEAESLLESITNSLSNLQFDNLENNSLSDPSVIILPQVAYEDIYRGLYDFEINLVANPSPRVPRVANSSIPEELLVTQESINNYNPRSFAFQSVSNNSDDYLSLSGYTPLEENSTNSNNQAAFNQYISTNQYINGNQSNSFLNNNSYENLSTRIRSVLSNNVNVFTNVTKIETQYDNTNSLSNPQPKKNPIQRELEQELAEQQKTREEQRRNLLKKLREERKVREQKRKQEQKIRKIKRETRLRALAERQKQALKNQRDRFSN